MDKLEKALQKARAERQRSLLQDGGGAAVNAGGDSRSSISLPGADVELSEIALEANRIFAHRARDAAADTFRLLRAQILQAMNKHGLRTLAITSPNYGDGKTTVAINLCLSIALDVNQTVLLADLDLRKPCVHKYLGISADTGLTNFLSNKMPISNILLRLPFERMTIIPAGPGLDHSSETLGSPEMARLASELKSRYPDRMVVYDMPPLLAQDDPLAFLPHVDAVLLVVRDCETSAADIKRSLELLSSTKVIGLVLNDAFLSAPKPGKRKGAA